MKKYKKITEKEVYLMMRGIKIDPMCCGYGISAKMIARSLSTSIYQARKQLNALREQGAVKLTEYHDVCTCYEYCECEATGLMYRLWVFGEDLKKYDVENKEQSKAFKDFLEEFVDGWEEKS